MRKNVFPDWSVLLVEDSTMTRGLLTQKDL